MVTNPAYSRSLTWTLIAALMIGSIACALAGGPAYSPICTLGNPNQPDRLRQVDDGDGTTVYDSTYTCRRTQGPIAPSMYFKLDDSYIYNGNYPIAHIAVKYLDSSTNPFCLQYDSTNDIWKQITINRTNTGLWKTYVFHLGDARFANREQGQYDFRLSDLATSPLYVKSVTVWCRKENAGTVSISGNQFMTNGTRFRMVGANYIAPWVTSWDWNLMWGTSYNATLVERDMTQMEYAGVNGIRVFMPFGNYVCSSEGTLNATVVSHLQDFLARAQSHGIKVIICLGGGAPDWLLSRIVSEYGGWIVPADYWAGLLYRKALADYLVQLCNTANIGQYDSFMAFDLFNEPTFPLCDPSQPDNFQTFYDSLSGPVGNSKTPLWAWNRWVNSKYGSLSNAYSAWNFQGPSDTAYTVYPEVLDRFLASGAWDKKIDDYYAFVADCFTEMTSYVRDRVRADALARALFTIDFGAGNPTDNLYNDRQSVRSLTNDWRRLGRACDFLDLHLYFWTTDPSTWRDNLVYFAANGTDKPVCITEFGNIGQTAPEKEVQRRTWQQMLAISGEARLDGCLGFMWIDSAGTGVPDYLFGIRDNNDVGKPAYDQFAQDNLAFQLTPLRNPTVTVEVDMDSYVSPWERFYNNIPSQGRTLIKNLFDQGAYPSFSSKRWMYPVTDTVYHLPTQTGDPTSNALGYGAARGAVVTQDTIPDFMVSGVSYGSQIQAMNVGTTSWTAGTNYRMGSYTTTFGVGRWTLSTGETIPQWASKAFSMTLTGPTTPGTYSDTWQMLQEGVTWFGQTHPHTIKVIAKPVRGATITSYSIPQVVNRSANFNSTVTVRNDGTATWTEASMFRLGAYGDSDPFAGTRFMLAPGESIAPGQSKTFTIPMVAPAVHGVYQSDWMMVQDGVDWFGQKIHAEVWVQ